TILVTEFREGYNRGTAALYLLSLADRSARPLIEDANTNVNAPGLSWSAAANRITYSTENNGAIWTIEPGSGAATRVAQNTGPPYFVEPTFSPDGQWIVFQADVPDEDDEEEQGSIWKVRTDGSGRTQLTNRPPAA